MFDILMAYFLNLIINGFLSFLMVWAAVEFFLFLLRVKNFRMRAIFLLLPIIKIIVDPFLYDFSSWSFLQGINPLTAKGGTRTLRATLGYEGFTEGVPIFFTFQAFTEEGATFTISDLFFFLYDSFFLRGAIFVFVLFTVYKAIIGIKKQKELQIYLGSIVRESHPCRREVLNRRLLTKIEKFSIRVFLREDFISPFSFWSRGPCIVFPRRLLQSLSQGEYEAVLGHELGHIYWRDGFLKRLFHFLQEVFWWIPMKKAFQKLERCMEFSCDRAIHGYSIDPINLAGALLKTARFKKAEEPSTVCRFASGKKLSERIARLFSDSKESKILFYFQMVGIACLSIALLFARLWIF